MNPPGYVKPLRFRLVFTCNGREEFVRNPGHALRQRAHHLANWCSSPATCATQLHQRDPDASTAEAKARARGRRP